MQEQLKRKGLLRRWMERKKPKPKTRNELTVGCETWDIEDRQPQARSSSPRKALTISAVTEFNNHQSSLGGTTDQMVVSLVDVLPIEIREQIYQHMIAEKCFHIVRKGDRLGYLLCQAHDPRSHFEDWCWGFEDKGGSFKNRQRCRISRSSGVLPWNSTDPQARKNTDPSLLPLLLTCRKVYSEVIEILYTRNQFCFNDAWTWFTFRSIVPAHRVNSIQSLHLEMMRIPGFYGIIMSRCFMPPEEPDRKTPTSVFFCLERDWINMWTSVRELRGLRHLDVRFINMPQFRNVPYSCGHHHYDHHPSAPPPHAGDDSDNQQLWRKEDRVWDPLREIRRLESFTLGLPFDLEHGWTSKDGDPFTAVYYVNVHRRL